jgi:hypothetical protein
VKQITKRVISLATVTLILTVIVISAFAGQARAAVPDWQVTITATCQGFSSNAILGVASDATDGFDTAYDALVPPNPQVGVVSEFFYPSNPSTPVDQRRLSTSIIPESPSMTWTLRVTPIATNDPSPMVLTWTTLPSGYSAYIKDSSGATILADMTQVTQYQYSASEGIRITMQVNLVVPEYPIGIMIAMGACFAGYAVFKKRKHQIKSNNSLSTFS